MVQCWELLCQHLIQRNLSLRPVPTGDENASTKEHSSGVQIFSAYSLNVSACACDCDCISQEWAATSQALVRAQRQIFPLLCLDAACQKTRANLSCLLFSRKLASKSWVREFGFMGIRTPSLALNCAKPLVSWSAVAATEQPLFGTWIGSTYKKMFLCEIPAKADYSTGAGIDSNSLTGGHSISRHFFLDCIESFYLAWDRFRDRKSMLRCALHLGE